MSGRWASNTVGNAVKNDGKKLLQVNCFHSDRIFLDVNLNHFLVSSAALSGFQIGLLDEVTSFLANH